MSEANTDLVVRMGVEKGGAMVFEKDFCCFDASNTFIVDNPDQIDGIDMSDVWVSYALVPAGTPFGDDLLYCRDIMIPWRPIDVEETDIIIDDYMAIDDSKTMKPCGIPCILRLFVEDEDCRLLFERDFGDFAELNDFIRQNPNKEAIANCDLPTITLGVVETIDGKPSRYPTALTDDDGLGIIWDPLGKDERKFMMSRYRAEYRARVRFALSLLSERDQEDLTSEEPSEKASLLLAIVHNLIRKHYDVAYAQSNALVGTWANGSAPYAFDTEIEFGDRYDFSVPVPEDIWYSQAQCKITVLPGTDPTGEYKKRVMEFDEEHRGLPHDEYSEAFREFSEANSNLWALRALLKWSEALPERP